jgi:hypothetical protein
MRCLIFLIAATTLASGCGGDDGDSSSDSGPTDELDGTEWIYLDPAVSNCFQLLSFSRGEYSNEIVCNVGEVEQIKGSYTYKGSELAWTPKQKTCAVMLDPATTMTVTLASDRLTLPTTDGGSVTFIKSERSGEKSASLKYGCFTDDGFEEHPLSPES